MNQSLPHLVQASAPGSEPVLLDQEKLLLLSEPIESKLVEQKRESCLTCAFYLFHAFHTHSPPGPARYPPPIRAFAGSV